MNIAKFSKWAIFTALIVVGSMGAPHQAQAAGGDGGGHIIVFDIVDAVADDTKEDTRSNTIVDEGSTADESQGTTIQPDPEYKYVPVRR